MMRFHLLANWVNEHGWTHGAEIGVQGGKTMSHLMQSCPDLHMLAVDPWAPTETGIPIQTEIFQIWQHAQNLEKVEKIAEDSGGRVRIMRMLSTEAAYMIDDLSLDFVFIDGDHSVESAYDDITAWFPKVRHGGMMIGHDYNWPSVKFVVDNLIPQFTLHENNCWAFNVDDGLASWIGSPAEAKKYNMEADRAYKDSHLHPNK